MKQASSKAGVLAARRTEQPTLLRLLAVVLLVLLLLPHQQQQVQSATHTHPLCRALRAPVGALRVAPVVVRALLGVVPGLQGAVACVCVCGVSVGARVHEAADRSTQAARCVRANGMSHPSQKQHTWPVLSLVRCHSSQALDMASAWARAARVIAQVSVGSSVRQQQPRAALPPTPHIPPRPPRHCASSQLSPSQLSWPQRQLRRKVLRAASQVSPLLPLVACVGGSSRSTPAAAATKQQRQQRRQIRQQQQQRQRQRPQKQQQHQQLPTCQLS